MRFILQWLQQRYLKLFFQMGWRRWGGEGWLACVGVMLEWRRWLMTQVMCHTLSYKRELLHFVHTNTNSHTYSTHTGLRRTFVYCSRSRKMKCKFVPVTFTQTQHVCVCVEEGVCLCGGECVFVWRRGASLHVLFTFTFSLRELWEGQ